MHTGFGKRARRGATAAGVPPVAPCARNAALGAPAVVALAALSALGATLRDTAVVAAAVAAEAAGSVGACGGAPKLNLAPAPRKALCAPLAALVVFVVFKSGAKLGLRILTPVASAFFGAAAAPLLCRAPACIKLPRETALLLPESDFISAFVD